MDEFGNSIAAVGDVNGDGYPDVLIGAPLNYNSLTSQRDGRRYLFHGPFQGPEIFTSQAAAVFNAVDAYDYLGLSVAAAGDVNGDGFSDILMGAPGYGSTEMHIGIACLFYGPVSGTFSMLDADALFLGDTHNYFGRSVAGNFDLNGDAVSDVAVGGEGPDSLGVVRVYFGPVAGTIPPAAADVTISGDVWHEMFGWALTIGDLNADGNDDLIAGAPGWNSYRGRVYVFFGPRAGVFVPSDADVILEGEVISDYFGISLGTGDVNGDGQDDLVVGAAQLYTNGTGRAYLFAGPLKNGVHSADSAKARFNSANFNNIRSDRFGEAVAAADVNGDGFDDVLIGDPNACLGSGSSGRFSGVAYQFNGPASGDIPAQKANQVAIGAGLGRLGAAIVNVGDLDGNGVDDVMFGEPSDDLWGHTPSKVRLMLSRIPGDVDYDGDVDLSDLAALLAAYGTCVGNPSYNPGAGLNGNQCVELSDLANLLAHYGAGRLAADQRRHFWEIPPPHTHMPPGLKRITNL